MLPEFRQVPVYCCPDFFGIHAKVIMDQNVTHGHDFSPWDLRMCGLDGVGEAAGCLSDNLNVVDGPGLEQFIAYKCCASSGRVMFDPFDGFQDVQETLAVTPHNETVSRRIASRTRGRRPRSVTTSTRRPSRRSRSTMSPA